MGLIHCDDRFVPDELRRRSEELLRPAAEALAELKAKTCRGAEWTGWFDWPRQHGFALKKEIDQYRERLDCYFDLVLVIGIGGSYLGTRAVSDALSSPYVGLSGQAGASRRPLMVYAGHHLSESELIEMMALLDERQPIVNVISKSGTTTEPGVAFRVVRTYMEKRFGQAEAARRIIATTDPNKGALGKLAAEQGYQTFAVPEDVGGRYSVLTAVGLVPLALGGFDIGALLTGGDELFGELRGEVSEHAVLAYGATRQAAFEHGKRIEILAFAEPRLRNVVEWWKQLFGESEGKDGKGLFPSGMAYTTDLHSLGQYVQDGCRNLLETFLVSGGEPGGDVAGVERRLKVPQAGSNLDELGYLEGRYIEEINGAAMQATKVAHFDGGVPCLELKTPRLDERGLGALFAFFETACAISGALLGVNPFDQPGVEAYKKNLFGLLGKPGYEQQGSEVRSRL